ncbi:LON peptidase substrate-binding domain-containing protein [Pseudovibrio sp. Tun.PSC04-5.I4]|uniref:LON peptidase substrate-binding domain-containing protein n=1 Tax=Pseudovibrio sp. Tun.PSC04-5.I4 TaxID=1798213 RepID=UPI000B80CB56|nr:LON peptidase substrate-binding domain-containing protein [Pseudovibrio sp. Tun.PSC04-5.I4]
MTIGNATYAGLDDLPQVVPLFVLPGAILLPRSHMPLNVFEPRYTAMIDSALRTDRMIGVIQPQFGTGEDELAGRPKLCTVGGMGRITGFQESGDGRYLITLSGVSRFVLRGELEERAPFRRGHVDANRFASDLKLGVGEDEVDREQLLSTLKEYLSVNELEADWESVNSATTEILVNALCMMSPYGPKEKQVLLETESLKIRADTLVALAEIELARGTGAPGSSLQ